VRTAALEVDLQLGKTDDTCHRGFHRQQQLRRVSIRLNPVTRPGHAEPTTSSVPEPLIG
jgi:hypothetical protein